MCKNICRKNKTNQNLNQGPPGLTSYALTTQSLPPLLLTVLYFCFLNGFLSLIRPEYPRRFYKYSIRSLEKMGVLLEWFQFKHIKTHGMLHGPRKQGMCKRRQEQ